MISRTYALTESAIFCQHSFLAFAATTVLLLAWMMCLNSACLLRITVSSSIVKKGALLQGFSMFAIGQTLQTPPLLCERALIQIGKPWVQLAS